MRSGHVAFTSTVACVALACQAPEGSETPLITPRGIYVPVPAEHAAGIGVDTLAGRSSSPLFVGPGDPPIPIFLNRFGGTYTPGPDDSRNNTSIIPQFNANVGGYSGSAAQWDAVVSCLTTMFAPYNAVIVEVEPGSGAYIEAVIGGSPGDVGLSNGVGGVAPIDTFNCRVIQNAIVFAFSDVFGSDPQTTCEVAAQEIAHAISLDHEYYCPDPMTYLNGCGDKTFRDYDAQCGEFSPRSCDCNRARQNSVQVLLEKLGASNGMPPPPPPDDPNPPTITITSPADGAQLQENSTITVTAVATDDLGIAATELFWQFSNTTFACPGTSSGGAVTCTRNGDTSTWQIRVGQGTRTFYARARDVGGNVTQTAARTIQLGTTAPPPNDTIAPVVNVVRPADQAQLPANSSIQIEATASDDVGLASVELMWTFANDSFPCPFQGQGVICEQNGTTYTWSLGVGVGTRQFSVRATDLAGNITETQVRTISLTTEAPPDPAVDTVAEDNDVPGEAFSTRCGTAIDLVVSSADEDWFAYEAPLGTGVEIGVNAAAGSVLGVELYDSSGAQLINGTTDVLGQGGSIRGTSLGPTMLVRITTPGNAVSYRLTGVCTAPDPNNPPATDDALEDNDAPENAVRVACGDSKKDLIAADDDFFVIDVAADSPLHIAVSGMAEATVLDANGQPMVPASGNDLMIESLPGGDVLVKVGPRANGAAYDVSFECNGIGPTELPTRVDTIGGGCGCTAHGEPASALGLVAVLGLLLSRRRPDARSGPRAAY
jgi:MYXO-CTERM domain-containing protein